MEEFLDLPLHPIQTALVEAGQWARAQARQPFAIEEKGPEDFVTTVDRALDQRLAAQFKTWFPNDGIITEENAQSIQAMQQGFSRLWLIDPLDGTEDFINGRPDYAIMVGLLEQSQPIAGWILRPESNQLFYGGPIGDYLLLEDSNRVSPCSHLNLPARPTPIVRCSWAIAIGNSMEQPLKASFLRSSFTRWAVLASKFLKLFRAARDFISISTDGLNYGTPSARLLWQKEQD